KRHTIHFSVAIHIAQCRICVAVFGAYPKLDVDIPIIVYGNMARSIIIASGLDAGRPSLVATNTLRFVRVPWAPRTLWLALRSLRHWPTANTVDDNQRFKPIWKIQPAVVIITFGQFRATLATEDAANSR